jgi:Flp pilus assembly protein CpaB
MRRGRIFFYIAFILILGLVAVLVVWQRVIKPAQSTASKATPTPPPVKVVVVTQNLKQGYTINKEVIQAVPWYQKSIPPGMFTEDQIPQVIGRMTKYAIEAQTPLFESLLVGPGEQIQVSGSSWAPVIPPQMVAVSIPINRLSSVSYAPRAGDHVNVIVTMLFVDLDSDFQTILPNKTGLVIASGPPDPVSGKNNPLTVDISTALYGKAVVDPVLGQPVWVVPSEEQRPRLISQMLIQDSVVLQLGNFPMTTQEAQPTAQPTQQGQQGAQAAAQQVLPETITLIVTPQDAVTLNYLMFSGSQLTLALRRPDDDSRLKINPVTLQFLLEQYEIPVPVRLPYGIQPRIDTLITPEVKTK